MLIALIIGSVCFLVVLVGLLFSRMENVNLTDEVTALRTIVADLKLQLDEAVKYAIYDHLTGLISRGEFERLLNLDFARRKRLEEGQCSPHESTTSLIFIDLDKFKDVNDTYGHEAGDCVLVHFSKFLINFFHRSSDVVCRLGGDEFVVLTTSTDPDNCKKILEAFSQALDNLFVEIPVGGLIKISASVGCSIASNHPDPQSLIREADKRMFEEKRG